VTSTDNVPVSGSITAGVDNNYVEQIEISASGGAVVVDNLAVQQVGDAADGSDIGAVRFYLDADQNEVADSPTPLGGVNATFSGGGDRDEREDGADAGGRRVRDGLVGDGEHDHGFYLRRLHDPGQHPGTDHHLRQLRFPAADCGG
jgi:hypothetical protein